MGMYAVDTADSADLAELGTAARDGRATAEARRRQLSQGKQALNGAVGPSAAENLQFNGAGGPPAAENLHADGAGAPPAARNGQGASNGTQGPSGGTAVATGGVAGAHLGRAVSMQRRRQLSQGKQALDGAGGPPAENLHADGAGAPPAARNGQGASNGTQGPSGGTAVATGGVAGAHLGRAVSMQRRRQLSQGKQALNAAGGDRTAAAAGAPVPAAAEGLHVDGAASGRELARARRAEASRSGSAAISRPQREGRVTYAPKVIASPTHGDQRVTGLRIGPGVRVTGDEPGAALPVSGTQYVAADGSAPAPGAGVKVGLARTPQGLVVTGTTVRNKVRITGDEAGEHLPITGEADQKLDDDLTPRTDGAYRSAQFPRRADPHGASAVGGRLAVQPPGQALEITDDGLAVTGTAVGRSGRVTGNEAGACRPITGDQYQNLYSTECGAMGGGTAPAAHLDRARLDPVTASKVTVAQTWKGQQITGPSLEYRPNVTGDEPGDCRPVTGTPYQGPSTIFGWCEPDEADPATQRLEPRPAGVAVSGDLPMHSKLVTGIERGHRNDITGSSYYGEMRPAEPAADDWARTHAFPVALARRLAGSESGAAARDTDDAALPASCLPGRITGAFAISAGKVTGNSEFLFRPRTVQTRDGTQTPITGEGRTDGRTVTGTAAAWTSHGLVTGTEGYIAAGRNPTEGGGPSNAWAGARRFKNLATPGGPNENARVTGRVGGTPKDGVRVTVSGGAQG